MSIIFYLGIVAVLAFIWTAWGMRKIVNEAQRSPKHTHHKKGSIVFLKDKVKHYTSADKR